MPLTNIKLLAYLSVVSEDNSSMFSVMSVRVLFINTQLYKLKKYRRVILYIVHTE